MPKKTWSKKVIELVRPAAGPDFPAHLRALAAAGDPEIERWCRADTDEEAGLEIWACRLAALDPRAGVMAVAAASRHVLPIVLERAGDEAVECGISEDAEGLDGAPEATKVALVEAWLAAPSDETRNAVEEAVDPCRQLEVWDDDLLPVDHEIAWRWFTGAGQLCASAVVYDDGPASGPFGSSSYEWPARVCAARGVVSAVKCLRTETADIAGDVAAVGSAIARAFGL